jgi:hypothetical protein
VAHSRPSTITNRGDAERITHAAGRFIVELMADRRVQAHQYLWVAAWAKGKAALDQLLERARMPGAGISAESITASIDAFQANVRAEVQRFVRTELQLKDAWIEWVADCLIEAFQISVYNAQHPDAPKQFGIPVYLAPGTPHGVAPRQEGLDIERNVRWFYVSEVFIPRVSITGLARDYQTSVSPPRENDCRSVVQNGIKQAEALLDLVATKSVRLPRPSRHPHYPK